MVTIHECKFDDVLALGLAVGTRGSKRAVRAVVLDTSNDSAIATIEHVVDPRHDEATQAREARDALLSALRAYDIGCAALLEADYNPKSRVVAGTKARLRIEGACLSACREVMPSVAVINGPALGRACGTTKDHAIATGKTIVTDAAYGEAAAAALAAKETAQAGDGT